MVVDHSVTMKTINMINELLKTSLEVEYQHGRKCLETCEDLKIKFLICSNNINIPFPPLIDMMFDQNIRVFSTWKFGNGGYITSIIVL